MTITIDTNDSLRRIFLVRPWHNPSASLYPYTMDGVEYIDAVIKKIKSVFSQETQEQYEVRVDEDVFVPGRTLRQNLERELTDADLVLVLLDGLRPNVVYELGFAYGQRRDSDEGAESKPQIVCLAEKNATVLVRNLYPEPLAVPTATGDKVRILNPKLDLCKMFSDNSDLLVLTYDRLDLDGSLGVRLKKLIDEIRREESKQAIVSEAAGAMDSLSMDEKPSSSDIWKLYEEKKYKAVVEKVGATASNENKKVLALAMMKLGQISEAIRVWQDLTTSDKPASAFFHLGVCYYAISEYLTAILCFERAKQLESGTRAQDWLQRAMKKLNRSPVADPASTTPNTPGTTP